MKMSDDCVNRIKDDALLSLLGIEVEEIGPGYARASLTVQAKHLNGVGITHGGTIFSLADIVFAAASNSHGPVAVALDMHISYLKATKVGEKITATAQEENLTAKTGLYRMEVRDSRGDLIAVAVGRVYRKSG